MEDSMRLRLEDLGLESDQIDEIIPLITEQQTPSYAVSVASEESLRVQLAAETDPTRRVVLAARIISLSLT